MANGSQLEALALSKLQNLNLGHSAMLTWSISKKKETILHPCQNVYPAEFSI
jgi:hypothetical protein